MALPNRPEASARASLSFSAKPKPVNGNRKKYRDPGEINTALYRDLKETCITWDKRVHRGNTYSLYTQTAIKDAFDEATQEISPKMRSNRKKKEPNLFDMPLPEKERIPVDLTAHLTAAEVVVEEDVAEAQTDEFLPEQPPDQYQPQKTGVDVSTQVEDGELFDFDTEVDPILDVLVSKTLEQSVMEVEEEFEMASMAEFKTQWMTRQKDMMADWREQVDEERRRWAYKEEVMQERRKVKRKEGQVLLKIQAVSVVKHHLANLVPNALADLNEVAFPDPQAQAIDRLFMPQLLQNVQQQVCGAVKSQQQVDGMIEACVRGRASAGVQASKKHHRRRSESERARFEQSQIRHGRIRIVVQTSPSSTVSIGPVQISSKDGIKQVENRVQEWLLAHNPEIASIFPHGVSLCIDGEPVKNTTAIFDSKAGSISLAPRSERRQEINEGADDEPGAEDGDAE